MSVNGVHGIASWGIVPCTTNALVVLTSLHWVVLVQSRSRMAPMISIRTRTLRNTPLPTRSSGAQQPCTKRG